METKSFTLMSYLAVNGSVKLVVCFHDYFDLDHVTRRVDYYQVITQRGSSEPTVTTVASLVPALEEYENNYHLITL